MDKQDGLTVLIVEDEPDFRELLAAEFSSNGHNPLTAPNGYVALEMAQGQRIAAIVTDIHMPHMDGLELLERVKMDDPSTPAVILISGSPDERLREEAYARGAEAFFTKPFGLQAFREQVCNVAMHPAERWRTRPAEEVTEWAQYRIAALGHAPEPGTLAIGRGGACLPSPGVRVTVEQRLGFTIEVGDGFNDPIDGIGVVRWVRGRAGGAKAAACGLEFEYLEDACRNDVADWIAERGPKAFIPSPFAGMDVA